MSDRTSGDCNAVSNVDWAKYHGVSTEEYLAAYGDGFSLPPSAAASDAISAGQSKMVADFSVAGNDHPEVGMQNAKSLADVGLIMYFTGSEPRLQQEAYGAEHLPHDLPNRPEGQIETA